MILNTNPVKSKPQTVTGSVGSYFHCYWYDGITFHEDSGNSNMTVAANSVFVVRDTGSSITFSGGIEEVYTEESRFSNTHICKVAGDFEIT